MSKRYTTIDGLFGTKIHLDENGNYAGESVPGLFNDTMIHYDANGNYAGSSMPGILSDTTSHYDAGGKYAGTSTRGLFSGTDHVGLDGRNGHSESLFGMMFTEIDD